MNYKENNLKKCLDLMKVSLKNVVKNKKRLITFLAFSFVPSFLFGTADMMLNLNRADIVSSTIAHSDDKLVTIKKKELLSDNTSGVDDFDYLNLSDRSLSNDDLNVLQDKIGLDTYGSFNNRKMIGPSYLNESNLEYGLYSSYHSFGNQYLLPFNYGKTYFNQELYEGSSYPIKKYEILVSDIFVDELNMYGLKDSKTNEILSPSQINAKNILGHYVSLGPDQLNENFEIVGVYKSNIDFSKYESLKKYNETNPSLKDLVFEYSSMMNADKNNIVYYSEEFLNDYKNYQSYYYANERSSIFFDNESNFDFDWVGKVNESHEIYKVNDNGLILSFGLISNYFQELYKKEKNSCLNSITINLDEEDMIDSNHLNNKLVFDFVSISDNYIIKTFLPIVCYRFASENFDKIIENQKDALKNIKYAGESLMTYVERYMSATDSTKKENKDVVCYKLSMIMTDRLQNKECSYDFSEYDSDIATLINQYFKKYKPSIRKLQKSYFIDLCTEYSLPKCALAFDYSSDVSFDYGVSGVDFDSTVSCVYFQNDGYINKYIDDVFSQAFCLNPNDSNKLKKIGEVHCEYGFKHDKPSGNKKGVYYLVDEYEVTRINDFIKIFKYISICLLILSALFVIFLGLYFNHYIGTALNEHNELLDYVGVSNHPKRCLIIGIILGIFFLSVFSTLVSLLFLFISSYLLNLLFSEFGNGYFMLLIPGIRQIGLIFALILIVGILFNITTLIKYSNKPWLVVK